MAAYKKTLMKKWKGIKIKGENAHRLNAVAIKITVRCFVCACPVISYSLWPPWTVAHQAPLRMRFHRQEYWSELKFPSPGDLSNPRIEPKILCRYKLFQNVWESRRARITDKIILKKRTKFCSTSGLLYSHSNQNHCGIDGGVDT